MPLFRIDDETELLEKEHLKIYGHGDGCLGVEDFEIAGDSDPTHVSTSFAERQKRTMRMCIVRRGKALFPGGCESRPATVAPAGSNRGG